MSGYGVTSQQAVTALVLAFGNLDPWERIALQVREYAAATEPWDRDWLEKTRAYLNRLVEQETRPRPFETDPQLIGVVKDGPTICPRCSTHLAYAAEPHVGVNGRLCTAQEVSADVHPFTHAPAAPPLPPPGWWLRKGGEG